MINETLSLNDMATFKKKYKKACTEGAITFQFKGICIVTDYAQYVIEYFSLTFIK